MSRERERDLKLWDWMYVITEGVKGGRKQSKIQVLSPAMLRSQGEELAKENEKEHPVK